MILKYFVKFPLHLFAYVLFHLSKLVRRDSNKWVFGSHFGFKDNAKFLLFDIDQNKQNEVRTIWISHNHADILKVRNLGFECYHWLSIKGLYHCFTAKVYVTTQNTIEINRFVSGGALYVNLNHGVGVKKCYWLRPDNLEKQFRKPMSVLERSFYFKVSTFPWLFRVPDVCLVPSEIQAKMFFAPMFRIPLSNCVLTNFPRTKILLENLAHIKELALRYEPQSTLDIIQKVENYSKVYIYMPTWRNDGSDLLKNSGIDFNQLDRALSERNELLVMKLHPYTHLDVSIVDKCKNIVSYPGDSDVYYFLPFTDCLITDYSSIYSEYLVMNKEIILFDFDLDYYLMHCTSLGDYNKYYPGRHAHNFDELLRIIKTDEDCHVPKEQRDFLMDFYWGSINSGVDIVEEVKKRIHQEN